VSDDGDVLAAALDYVARGWPVFPCKPRAKVPATIDGFKSATTDADTVREWWRRWPDANVAIRTGAESDLVVLDVDVQHGGAGTLAELERERGKLPKTPRVLTGGGGQHVYFRHPGDEVRNSAGRLGPGLDVRGDGGYVVAPPSVHENGRDYKWLIAPERPSELLTWLVADARERRNGSAGPVGAKIPHGQQHDTLVSVAGSMRRKGLTEDEIFAALWVMNQTRCERPGPEANIRRIAKSVAEYEPEDAAHTDEAEIIWLNEVGLKQVEYVERPLLQVAFTLVAGRPGVGKGALCARWVARCSTGDMYGTPRRVLWLSSEDDPEIDLGPRVEAAGGDRSQVALIPSTFRLPEGIEWLRTTIDTIGNVGLIVIDPIGNHLGVANTDRDGEVRGALMPLAVFANEIHLPVLGIRHFTTKELATGAVAKILGSTAWVGIPRVVLGVAADNNDPSLVHVSAIKGNRAAGGENGRRFRLEGRLLPGFTETVVHAVADGESTADIDSLLGARGDAETKSGAARELILDILENEGEQESDALDARVARETGVAARTAKNIRGTMKTEGLLKAFPEKDEYGEITRWLVARTQAPR